SLALVAAELNTLTPEEKAAGWKLLFDGTSLDGWRNFKKKEPPKQGWVVEDGILKKVSTASGGGNLTQKLFDKFDLQWDWRISPKGNNGIKYFIIEERNAAIGHEYQMIDDEGNSDGKVGPKHQTASFYDVLPPKADKPPTKPGEWHHSRVLVQGN